MVITGLEIGRKRLHDGQKCVHSDCVKYGRMIQGFLDGSIKDLSSLPLDFTGISGFSKKVLTTARSIPYGKTVSYAKLSAMAGKPMAVRAAASIMRNNPFPLIIPCHRVIRSDGSIGGFMGKLKGKEIRLKYRLLKREMR
jgi:methylated-DNA-[protein]-cysteine S-methyltransferase